MSREYRHNAGRFRLEVGQFNEMRIVFDHNGHVESVIDSCGDCLEDLKDLQYLLSRALENRT